MKKKQFHVQCGLPNGIQEHDRLAGNMLNQSGVYSWIKISNRKFKLFWNPSYCGCWREGMCYCIYFWAVFWESLRESSKVPVWDVTFSVRIYYVFPNTHSSCTVPVNITFGETGSLKGRVLFQSLNTRLPKLVLIKGKKMWRKLWGEEET